MSSSTPGSSGPAEEISKSALKRAAKDAQRAAAKAAKGVRPTADNLTKGSNSSSRAASKKEKAALVKTEEQTFVNKTPDGEKKDMTQPMENGYHPPAVEFAWYSWWVKSGFFEPEFGPDGKIKPAGVFVVPAPPPNVTGSLHIGHALTIAIQDTLVRWNRMLGKTVLFNPGFDHAGISTQSVVEKRLFKSTGLTRHDLGREKFLEKVFSWKEEYQSRITNQLNRLGASYDWGRARFTMDPQLSRAVVEAFVRLHDEGVIYRSKRLVNWCVRLNTVLSNEEVDQMEIQGRTMLNVPGYEAHEKFEFGVMVYFAWKIEGTDERITVGTTRPETMLGDVAIAVNPKDTRYKHLIGKHPIHPFIPSRKMVIVADEIADPEKGTGAVKITPAHSFEDYEVGVRHNLEFINVLNDDGTMNSNAGSDFSGMKRFHARKAVVEKLKSKGLWIATKDNDRMQIPICFKSGDIIEPLIKPQWWLSCKDISRETIKRAEAGELKIAPKVTEKEWYGWLEGMRDWCISRQLWWGHRCPVYFVNIEGQGQDEADDKYWVAGRTLEEAQSKATAKFPNEKFVLSQDEDVLDTWFSSGLWPFAIMGWPDQAGTPDLERFYPSSLLETGWDIIFFWVAKMTILGVKLTGKMPFSEVFCHAMIRDAHGRKMSKSKGNVIDPIDVIDGVTLEALAAQLQTGNLDEKELKKALAGQKADFGKTNGIPQCGADALRFALCAYTSSSRSINLDVLRIEGYRKFCNKLWNATKFALLKLEDGFIPRQSPEASGDESLVEKWILHKLNECSQNLNKLLEERSFMAATSSVYDFWLYDLCDVYIEAMKPITMPDSPASVKISAQNTLYTCLDHGLRLLHPFMPFVTEELWQRLPRRPQDTNPTICKASFPIYSSKLDFPKESRDFEVVFAAVKAVRSIAAPYGLRSNLQVTVCSLESDTSKLLRGQIPTIQALIKGCTSIVVVSSNDQVPPGCLAQSIDADVSVHLLVAGVLDLEKEIDKAQKKIESINLSLDKLKKQTQIPGYETKIPEDVRDNNTKTLMNHESEIITLREQINNFTLMIK
ncbi:valyl-tRNA synthetase [Phakopsora pachyrhizi]|uniref:Valine--tRNA ligase, mitochondrial n=1 Tax=Phakopsora pachyrhizi TaxID=170000 RepID=A0AAV0AHC9_PHAPC|nr:valyl-tRNA synthetase [Phakopsora pachyrhizi]CAH7666573.1 valyl-tRNA synthetase [Phakopsora pachyrhizi]